MQTNPFKRFFIFTYCLTAIFFSAGTGHTAAETTVEINWQEYFNGVNGTAIFYYPEADAYAVYQKELSEKRSSPCSTFKIFSTYVGVDTGVIQMNDSVRKWNGTAYWYEPWNRDIGLPDAFRQSCVWYYRQVIDDIGQPVMQAYIDEMNYGNRDISDWQGDLNEGEPLTGLKGFWLESSLKISPKEQIEVLRRIMEDPAKGEIADTLKLLMLTRDDAATSLKVYGKTGFGRVDGKNADAWFVGLYETNGKTVYFAVRLDDLDNPKATSDKAREIALSIISDRGFYDLEKKM
ncbi:class D beta-lactamase [Megasphaera sp. SW808]|nr:penicillin-binding transpeptidase domain-containing protein [Megasphaera sp. SW808]NJE34728.1 class D beta-lactamase [Megasphaera sp. SW808]